MKFVSIIVPVYNSESFIEQCIESILNQTYSNLEIILVDNGSSDNSFKLCKKWENENVGIEYLEYINGGQNESSN